MLNRFSSAVSRLALSLGLVVWLFLGLNCGDKLSLSQFPVVPNTDPVPVRYVPLAWAASLNNRFSAPTDIIAGYDGTFYFIESGTERIINIDASGAIISDGRLEDGLEAGVSQRIRKPRAIAQTRNMQLLVTAVVEATVQGQTIEQAAILRFNLVDTVGGIPRRLNLRDAKLDTVYRHPTTSLAEANKNIRYSAIGTFYDNSFIVTRIGNVRSNDIFASSNAALTFPAGFNVNSSNPNLRDPSPVSLPTNGNGYGFVDSVSSLATLANPPQSGDVNTSLNFLFTTVVPEQQFKVHRAEFSVSSTSIGYVPDLSLLNQNTTLGDRFIGEINRFTAPSDIAVAPNAIFLLDGDSLYQFNSSGVEGVQPPPNSPDTRNIIVSFNRFGVARDSVIKIDSTRSDTILLGDKLNQPKGVCYLAPYLYISDTGNGRILRMILTSDLN